MKHAHTLEAYQRAGDMAGVMVMTLLAYRKPIETAEKQAEDMNARWAKLNNGQKLFVRLVLQWNDRDLRGILDKLEATFVCRAPIKFSDSATRYFNSIFPQFPETTKRAGNMAPLLLPATSSVYSYASELLELPYLITESPDRWKVESRLFKKRELYAKQLAGRTDFREDVEALRKQHKSELESAQYPLIGNPDTSCVEGRLNHTLAALCAKYSILGLTSRFQPLPNTFSLESCGNVVRMIVPNYMEFNWRDDVPIDAFKLLQRRRNVVYQTRPYRLSDQDRSTNDYAYDAQLLQAHGKLLSSGVKGNALWDGLLEQFPHVTHAQGPDDRRRVMSRRVQRLMAHIN